MKTKFRNVRMASSFLLAFALIAPSVDAASVPYRLNLANGPPIGATSIPDGAEVILVERRSGHDSDRGDYRTNRTRNNGSLMCRDNPQRCKDIYDRGNARDHRNSGGQHYDRNDDHPRYRGGYRGYSNQRQGYRQSDDGWWYPFAAFALGAIILNQQNNNTQNYQNQGSSNWSHIPAGNMTLHDNWCDQKYRSYSRSSKTFQPYNGPRQYCNSPYDLL
ncbi:MAG: BA14K family protein [Cypionkella sp.]